MKSDQLVININNKAEKNQVQLFQYKILPLQFDHKVYHNLLLNYNVSERTLVTNCSGTLVVLFWRV